MSGCILDTTDTLQCQLMTDDLDWTTANSFWQDARMNLQLFSLGATKADKGPDV